MSKQGALFGITDLQFAVKLAPTIFDLANVVAIYFITRTIRGGKYALIAAALYAFNPATIYNSAVWGQYDSVFTFFLLLAAFLGLSSVPELAGVAFGLALLTKPQSVALIPILVFAVARKHGLTRLATSVLAVFLTAVLVALPFGQSNPVSFLWSRYLESYGVYPYNSLNAFNIWGLMGFWKPDNQLLFPFLPFLTLSTAGWLLFGGATAAILYRLNKQWRDPDQTPVFFGAATLLFAFFMLPTRMHERYLFPAVPMFLLSGHLEVFYVLVSLSYLFNQVYAASFLSMNAFIPDFDSVVILLCAANTILFLFILKVPAKMRSRNLIKSLPLTPLRKGLNRIERRDMLVVLVISSVFFGVASWGLGATSWPQTVWQPKGAEEFAVDIGSTWDVRSLGLLLRDSNPVRGGIACGAPGEFAHSIPFSNEGYYSSWYMLTIGCTTRYLNVRFDDVAPKTAGAVSEIALFSNNWTKIPIAAVLPLASGGDRLANLYDEQSSVEAPPSYFSSAYFDEIYFVRTAEEHLRLTFPFEWTHPPLGKLIIATGIVIFGYNPFGWRILGVVFATLMIPLIYFLAREMFETRWGATVAAILLAVDFMHLTMARIATADTYLVLFTILMHLFLFRYFIAPLNGNSRGKPAIYIVLGTLAFSLGFATKWVALYGFAGAIFLLFLQEIQRIEATPGKILPLLRTRLARPATVLILSLAGGAILYFATYVPVMLAGYTFPQIISLQESMFRYHSGLTATHPFSSSWWTWPLLLQPVWFAFYSLKGGLVSTITSMGNPAIWWTAIPAIGLAFWRALKKSDATALYIGTVFMFNWIAYAPITRVLFIYHFYENVPIAVLAIGLCVDQLVRRKWGIPICVAYVATAVILFWLFFPVLSGIPTTPALTEQLKWLTKWYF